MERVAKQLFEMLEEVRLGTIVAVWRDGSVSAHRSLGFRYRTLPDGSREEPMTSFVKEGEVRSVAMILTRIQRAIGIGTEPG